MEVILVYKPTSITGGPILYSSVKKMARASQPQRWPGENGPCDLSLMGPKDQGDSQWTCLVGG